MIMNANDVAEPEEPDNHHVAGALSVLDRIEQLEELFRESLAHIVESFGRQMTDLKHTISSANEDELCMRLPIQTSTVRTKSPLASSQLETNIPGDLSDPRIHGSRELRLYSGDAHGTALFPERSATERRGFPTATVGPLGELQRKILQLESRLQSMGEPVIYMDALSNHEDDLERFDCANQSMQVRLSKSSAGLDYSSLFPSFHNQSRPDESCAG